jgi:hypothetical protein
MLLRKSVEVYNINVSILIITSHFHLAIHMMVLGIISLIEGY